MNKKDEYAWMHRNKFTETFIENAERKNIYGDRLAKKWKEGMSIEEFIKMDLEERDKIDKMTKAQVLRSAKRRADRTKKKMETKA